MEQATRHRGLRQLDRLTGTWDLDIAVHGQNVGSTRSEFEWMQGEAFLIQRTPGDSNADVNRSEPRTEWEEHAPISVTMIIGLDDTNECYSALYADSRDVFRVYQMTLNNENWNMWREAQGFSQRFTGSFSEDGATITCRWEKSFDGQAWEYDFDLIYTKVANGSNSAARG